MVIDCAFAIVMILFAVVLMSIGYIAIDSKKANDKEKEAIQHGCGQYNNQDKKKKKEIVVATYTIEKIFNSDTNKYSMRRTNKGFELHTLLGILVVSEREVNDIIAGKIKVKKAKEKGNG